MNHSRTMLSILAIVLMINLAYSQPHELTQQNFQQFFGCKLWQYQNSFTPMRDWFIMFMAPWCGHCNRAKPAFGQFQNAIVYQVIKQHQSVASSTDLDKIIQLSTQVAIVDCDKQEELCSYFGIQSYPTFIYLTAQKIPIKYTGPRSKQAFMNFTKFHNPETDLYCEPARLANSVWTQIFDIIIENWVQVLIFGLVGPVLLGYVLGTFINKKKQQKNQINIQQTTINVSHKAEKNSQSSDKQKEGKAKTQ